MNDSEKIDALRTLLSTVVSNTKSEIHSKPVKVAKELKSTTEVLKLMLGRTPTPDEIALASTY